MSEYIVTQTPVADILVDNDFNCRGEFRPESVKDLADAILEVGQLICPVIVQPWNKDGFKYRLIAGFRRVCAVTTYLKWTEILAHVADVTDHEAHLLNLVENLERKNLNILEEAQGIRKVYPEQVSIEQAAIELKRPKGWVRARFALLKLSDKIQQQAAAGLLNAADILKLIDLTTDEQLTYVGKVVEQRALPKYRLIPHKKGQYVRATKSQIHRMTRALLQLGIDGLPTRALAWSAGDVSTEDFMEDVKMVVKKLRESDVDSGGV